MEMSMPELTVPLVQYARLTMKALILRVYGQYYRQQSPSTPLFPIGSVVVTAAAMHALRNAAVSVDSLVRRHARGDWGDVDALDARQNKLALRFGLRILSSYVLPPGHQPSSESCTAWVITTPNRKTTTVLLSVETFNDTNHGQIA
jgi:hypothetical protein